MPSVTQAPVERRIVSGGQIPVTFERVFKSQWVAITSQISCKGITVLFASVLSHSCNENFLLYILVLKSVLWESGTKCKERKPSLHFFFL